MDARRPAHRRPHSDLQRAYVLLRSGAVRELRATDDGKLIGIRNAHAI
jgi:hypothetical protein